MTKVLAANNKALWPNHDSLADVKYKSLSINLAKDIKDDYSDHYYDSALTDGVLFQNYFLPQVVPSQPSEDGLVRVENMVERGVGHILSLP